MVGLLRLNMQQAFSCAILLLVVQTACAKKNDDLSHEQNNNFQRNNSSGKSDTDTTETQSINRRQDGGFDFMKYFIGRGQDVQDDEEPAQQQLHQVQQPLSVQQQHQLQQQILKEQQRRQQEQLLQLQQQQLVTLQQQQPAATYQQVPQSRDGGYGSGISIGSGYGAPQPKEIAISIGGGKPVLQIGNILKILPRIINVLSAGGKVMFGVELGNNFYFGPVGAKPLVKG
ncbi:putative uncharacterized protein DDB_G0271606 [Argiope bruennichi]|uniref:Uncharacterized protein n=1 Tax=Argiope bruennichi TaxID=94029 RepID=A0A8T0G2W6_ARGBR|nr:putative uncharacterized protein DDB_G0271606 [Argiope bruennichi]KAF8796189.1 hypothetical protein HNY73_000601 [Argiope bruennichi]